MEVSSIGEYYLTRWNKNGNIIQTGLMTSFAHFMEIYYIEPTSLFDVGVYEVFAPPVNELTMPGGGVQFAVINIGIISMIIIIAVPALLYGVQV